MSCGPAFEIGSRVYAGGNFKKYGTIEGECSGKVKLRLDSHEEETYINDVPVAELHPVLIVSVYSSHSCSSKINELLGDIDDKVGVASNIKLLLKKLTSSPYRNRVENSQLVESFKKLFVDDFDKIFKSVTAEGADLELEKVTEGSNSVEVDPKAQTRAEHAPVLRECEIVSVFGAQDHPELLSVHQVDGNEEGTTYNVLGIKCSVVSFKGDPDNVGKSSLLWFPEDSSKVPQGKASAGDIGIFFDASASRGIITQVDYAVELKVLPRADASTTDARGHIPTPVYHFLLEMIGRHSKSPPPPLQRSLLEEKMRLLRNSFFNEDVVNSVMELAMPLTLSPSDPRAGKFKGGFFHGDPGGGKSTVSSFFADELGFRIIFRGAPSKFESKYIGQSAKNIRACFGTAKQYPFIPHIMCLEEADSVMSSRDLKSSQHDVGCVAELLTEIDIMTNVTILCTTNRFSYIDPALKRSGRLDGSICFGPLSPTERLTLFRASLKKMGYSEYLDLGTNEERALLLRLSGLNGSAIVGVAKRMNSRLLCVEKRPPNELLWPDILSTLIKVINEVRESIGLPSCDDLENKDNYFMPELQSIFQKREALLGDLFTGIIICDAPSGLLYLEMYDGSTYPIQLACDYRAAPESFGSRLTLKFQVAVMTALQCYNSFRLNSASMRFVKEKGHADIVQQFRQAGLSGGACVIIDARDIGSPCEHKHSSTQSSLSLGRHEEFYIMNSIIREASYVKGSQFCICFVLCTSSFILEKLEGSKRPKVDGNLVKGLQQIEQRITLEADSACFAVERPYFWRPTLSTQSSYLFTFRALFSTDAGAYVIVGLAEEEVINIQSRRGPAFCIHNKGINTHFIDCWTEMPGLVGSSYSGCTFGMLLDGSSLHLLLLSKGAWKHLVGIEASNAIWKPYVNLVKSGSSIELIQLRAVPRCWTCLNELPLSSKGMHSSISCVSRLENPTITCKSIAADNDNSVIRSAFPSIQSHSDEVPYLVEFSGTLKAAGVIFGLWQKAKENLEPGDAWKNFAGIKRTSTSMTLIYAGCEKTLPVSLWEKMEKMITKAETAVQLSFLLLPRTQGTNKGWEVHLLGRGKEEAEFTYLGRIVDMLRFEDGPITPAVQLKTGQSISYGQTISWKLQAGRINLENGCIEGFPGGKDFWNRVALICARSITLDGRMLQTVKKWDTRFAPLITSHPRLIIFNMREALSPIVKNSSSSKNDTNE